MDMQLLLLSCMHHAVTNGQSGEVGTRGVEGRGEMEGDPHTPIPEMSFYRSQYADSNVRHITMIYQRVLCVLRPIGRERKYRGTNGGLLRNIG